jgi:nucleoside-triphosphatase THEP1
MIKTNKTCNVCGIHHTEVPENNRVDQFGVLYWECDCKYILAHVLDEEKQKVKEWREKKALRFLHLRL